MDDTIYRQAAIDAAWFLHPDDRDAIRDTLKDLPSAQPEMRWIPVTERLPEAGIRYQVTFESGEVGYADFRNKIFFYDGSAKENVWEIERYYEDDGEVIAWMSLPKRYERSE